jgi:hypothetical protein|tara:strand:+ start:4523 stop:4846 length:324 start_codon:yes stop_codon:yes gene_type:complete
MLQRIVSQRLLPNSQEISIALGRDRKVSALIFAHSGSSNAVVQVYAIPDVRPDSTKSNYKIYHTTVTAATTNVFRLEDIELDFSNHALEVETDSNGGGHIMLTVVGN